MKPAIVVIGFNRPHSLNRLLTSLTKANYGNETAIPLCISIDYQGSAEHKEVVELAEAFNWEFGEKYIFYHVKNLGLKKHVLKCGDLTDRFGAIIMLEDDLCVSPEFYNYSKQAIEFYGRNASIAGISLYNHQQNFNNQLPFQPLKDGYSIYFLQIASSWGQVWTNRQWRQFRDWHEENQVIPHSAKMPNYIINWPDSSWLKHFIHYLVSNAKYFVYPRNSLTTNFSDSGTNSVHANPFFQVPLSLKQNHINFCDLQESTAVYDSFFELKPAYLKDLNHALKGYDFEVDLYGLKVVEKIDHPFLLTSKVGKHALMCFGLAMKPMEMNIIYQVEGDFFCLVRKEDITGHSKFAKGYKKYIFNWLYGIIGYNVKAKNLINILKIKAWALLQNLLRKG